MAIETSLEEYFRAVGEEGLSSLWKIEVNLLNREGVEDLTHQFRGHPIIEHLRGSVLDDPGTSNHHILLRRPPLTGQVLYLAHDDNSRIVFLSLAALLASVQRAKAENVPLPDLHDSISPLTPRQDELSKLIRTLVAEGEVDVALTLIPSMDLSDHALLADLVVHENFFLGEAVAEAIRARPSSGLIALAGEYAAHSHPQVARAGRLAMEACGK